jgi:AraC-like DNA-binding protein
MRRIERKFFLSFTLINMLSLPAIPASLLSFLIGAACLHGIFLSLLLLLKGEKRKPHYFLALALLCMSLYLFNYLLFLTGMIVQMPYLLNVFHVPVYLLGPGFYLFVVYTLQPDSKFQERDIFHLLPLVYGVWKSVPVFMAASKAKAMFISQILHPESLDMRWRDFLWVNVSGYLLLGYAIAAFWLCRKRDLEKPGEVGVKSLLRFCGGFALLVTLDMIVKFGSFSLQTPAAGVEYLLAGLLAISIHLIAYASIGKFQAFPSLAPAPQKYKTSALDAAQIRHYTQQLHQLMEQEKPWLEPDLKIAKLAELLALPSHQLSQVLSEGVQTSFHDFVNSYRIAEAQKRLRAPAYQHYSILAIAMDVGFSNKATFNRVFKKIAGVTPSAYMKAVSN